MKEKEVAEIKRTRERINRLILVIWMRSVSGDSQKFHLHNLQCTQHSLILGTLEKDQNLEESEKEMGFATYKLNVVVGQTVQNTEERPMWKKKKSAYCLQIEGSQT